MAQRRLHYNFTQYKNSFTPEYWEGGGGWGQLKFSLGSLFEERDYLRNKWSKSNVALPLCRYTGCRFKFWRQWDMDYIVYYSNCLPMLDTLIQHINAHPFNMLLYKHKIIVKSQKSTPKRKPYKKIRIKPPEQFKNTWYFQADFASQGLVLLTATAADFNRPYLNPKAISNSITLNCLNTTIFKNHNFKQANMGTATWSPNNNNYYYITLNGPGSKVSDLIYCGQTTTNTLGKPVGDTDEAVYNRKSDWTINYANIFHHQVLNDEVTLWVSSNSPQVMFNKTNIPRNTPLTDNKTKLTLASQPLIKKVRYNPDRDRGNNNTIFFKETYSNTPGWDLPTDPDLYTDGFPLWCLLWGWEDWIKKYKKLQLMQTDYILGINTDIMSDKLEEYIIIDHTYIEGHSPYQDKFNPEDYNTWYPCLRTQMLSIEDICTSGPLTCKTSTQSIEAHCSYDFFFKWGGCPNQLENITDPEKQGHYPTPHNISEAIQITDPTNPPEYETYPFDYRRHTITQRAAKRIKTDIETTILSSTDTKLNSEPQETQQTPQEEIQQTQTTEEEEAPLLQQLRDLQQHRRKLNRQLQRLMSTTPNIKY